jgi:hypothetical protein
MRRVNGIGVVLLGRVADAAIAPARVKLLWLTILFVPLLPLRAYAVTGGSAGYYFHGEMGLLRFLRRYRWRVFPYLLTVIVESVLRAAILIALFVAVAAFVAWIFGRL